MTPEETAKLLKTPLPRLIELAKDPASLMAILNLAINIGIQIGQNQMNRSYHQMLSGYNEVSLKN